MQQLSFLPGAMTPGERSLILRALKTLDQMCIRDSCIPAFTIHFSPKSNNSRSLPVALTARNLMSPFGT